MSNISKTSEGPAPLRSINGLRTLAHTLGELQRTETLPLRLTDDMVDDQEDTNRIQTGQDDTFRTAWNTICDDILCELGMGKPELTSTMSTDVPAHERYEAAIVPRASIGYNPVALSVRYYAIGRVTVNAQYSLRPSDDSMRRFYKGPIKNYDLITAGEHVANASITCLVMHGLTAPEALDYWQTDASGDYSQVGWEKNAVSLTRRLRRMRGKRG